MKIRILSLFIVVFAVSVSFQNCAKNFHASTEADADIFQLAADCMTSDADACIFSKSPVAQSGKSVTHQTVGGHQIFGAQITGRDNSGYLQNSDFRIVTLATPRLHAQEGFKHYYSPHRSHLEQVMAFHEIRTARDWMRERAFNADQGGNVAVIVDSDFNGWVPARNEIHLNRNGVELPAALDGSIILNLFAQSAIHKASGGESHIGLATSSMSCNDSKGYPFANGCCRTNLGCGAALISGASDAFVALFYGNGRSAIGQGWKNDYAGLSTCGRSRDPAMNSSLTLQSASAQCHFRGAANQVQAMGTLYASIWWQVRQKTQDPFGLERLFLAHLALIRGEDDFATMKTKILDLDAGSFNGRFSALLNQEFSLRGL